MYARQVGSTGCSTLHGLYFGMSVDRTAGKDGCERVTGRIRWRRSRVAKYLPAYPPFGLRANGHQTVLLIPHQRGWLSARRHVGRAVHEHGLTPPTASGVCWCASSRYNTVCPLRPCLMPLIATAESVLARLTLREKLKQLGLHRTFSEAGPDVGG